MEIRCCLTQIINALTHDQLPLPSSLVPVEKKTNGNVDQHLPKLMFKIYYLTQCVYL